MSAPRQAAGLCRKAGADLEAIPAWIAEGRRRGAAPEGRREAAAVLRWPARRGRSLT